MTRERMSRDWSDEKGISTRREKRTLSPPAYAQPLPGVLLSLPPTLTISLSIPSLSLDERITITTATPNELRPTMALRGAAHYLSLLLIALPSIFFVLRFLASFPLPPIPVAVYPSLSTLPPAVAERAHQIYPENFYGGGEYVSLPCGRVSSRVFPGEQGVC